MSNPPAEILNQQPSALLLWVQQRLSREVTSDAGFNWHGLAEVAAMNAHEQGDSPVWAEIAVRVYSWLASRSEARVAASFTLSEMYVRAHQISRHGAHPGHVVRDPTALLIWFRKSRQLSLAEVAVKATNWDSLPVSEVAKLRDIKNQLGVFVEPLLDNLSSTDRSEVQRWLELRPRLP